MYKLCRGWMNASTNTIDKKNEKNVESEDENIDDLEVGADELDHFITKLPEPIKLKSNLTIEQVNANIKNEIRVTTQSDMELIKSLNVNDVIQTHALLKLHVNRWKLSRIEWLKYHNEKNKPFKNSHDVLRSIFEEI